MTNPPIVIFMEVEGKILEVVTTKEERVKIYELLSSEKRITVIDRDVKGCVLEGFK